MEHFIRIAFWIVTLSACLPGDSAPVADINDSNIKIIRRDVECEQDAKFYVQSNVKEECFSAALDCFKLELNGTVRDECEISQDRKYILNQAVRFLEKTKEEVAKQRNGNVPTNTAQCSCETAPQKPFKEFLNGLESLLQSINDSS